MGVAGLKGFKALLLCTLQGPLSVSGTFLHFLFLPLPSTYKKPHIGFVASESVGCWDDIKLRFQNFLKDKAEIYYDDDKKKEVFSEILNRCIDAVEQYMDNSNEKDLRQNVSEIMNELFATIKPVITLQMVNGEKLEPILAAITGIDENEFRQLRSEIATAISGDEDDDDATETNGPTGFEVVTEETD